MRLSRGALPETEGLHQPELLKKMVPTPLSLIGVNLRLEEPILVAAIVPTDVTEVVIPPYVKELGPNIFKGIKQSLK